MFIFNKKTWIFLILKYDSLFQNNSSNFNYKKLKLKEIKFFNCLTIYLFNNILMPTATGTFFWWASKPNYHVISSTRSNILCTMTM